VIHLSLSQPLRSIFSVSRLYSRRAACNLRRPSALTWIAVQSFHELNKTSWSKLHTRSWFAWVLSDSQTKIVVLVQISEVRRAYYAFFFMYLNVCDKSNYNCIFTNTQFIDKSMLKISTNTDSGRVKFVRHNLTTSPHHLFNCRYVNNIYKDVVEICRSTKLHIHISSSSLITVTIPKPVYRIFVSAPSFHIALYNMALLSYKMSESALRV
jgi:hypothetical protein